jgi:signal transduction histidine kinase
MIKKVSLRWRLTIMNALLIIICCIGLTIVLNYSANRLADTIDAAVITAPAQSIGAAPNMESEEMKPVPSTLTESTLQAKRGYRVESVIYTIISVLIGSIFTYYVAGRALRPVKILNEQVKNINVHNLSESLDMPPARDEIAELTESFNDMTDKLNDAFLMQQRFSASAAHELRTPLAVLQAKMDVFHKKELHSVGEYDALIASFQKQTGKLRELVGDLLDMTNMEDDPRMQSFMLRDLFEDIFDELTHIAKDKCITLSLQSDDSSIYGNPDLLYRAFYNLVENAIKYNVRNGTVEISAYHDKEDNAIVSIKDSGIGIPEALKKHIFEPFYRVDKSRSREMGGAGLGLSITDSILKKHNGTITVSDNATGGTCFIISIPNRSQIG